MSTQLIKAERDGKPLASATLAHYTQQLEKFDEEKRRFRELVAQWWSLIENGEKPH